MYKILVIEDDADIAEALQLTFEEAGFAAQTSDADVDLIALAKSYKPDLIMLDLLLSGVDGREVCKALKKDAATKEIPILFTSAHPDAKRSSVEAGADDFIAKPFDITELVGTVEKLITKN